jgi:cystathionine gamma-synthase
MDSISFLTLKCYNVAAIADMVHQKSKAKLVVDNTFFTPVFLNPLTLGADIVIHCVTKYISGLADVSAGAICLNDPLDYDNFSEKTNAAGHYLTAICAFLATQSALTMELRVKQAATSAAAIAEYLCTRWKVTSVIYPGLFVHPDY